METPLINGVSEPLHIETKGQQCVEIPISLTGDEYGLIDRLREPLINCSRIHPSESPCADIQRYFIWVNEESDLVQKIFHSLSDLKVPIHYITYPWTCLFNNVFWFVLISVCVHLCVHVHTWVCIHEYNIYKCIGEYMPAHIQRQK